MWLRLMRARSLSRKAYCKSKNKTWLARYWRVSHPPVCSNGSENDRCADLPQIAQHCPELCQFERSVGLIAQAVVLLSHSMGGTYQHLNPFGLHAAFLSFCPAEGCAVPVNGNLLDSAQPAASGKVAIADNCTKVPHHWPRHVSVAF